MPEPTPESGLQATALRYAAGDLSPDEVAAFEARLAEDQDARDALAEAVRLSAAAIGQKPPAPHPSFRTAIQVRLGLMADRGRPWAWAGAGAGAVAACVFVVLAFADPAHALEAAVASPAPAPVEPSPAPYAEELPAPALTSPHESGVSIAVEHPHACSPCGDPSRSVAEIWADLSTPEHVEKARDDEVRWRQHVRNLSHAHHVSASVKAAGMTDAPQP